MEVGAAEHRRGPGLSPDPDRGLRRVVLHEVRRSRCRGREDGGQFRPLEHLSQEIAEFARAARLDALGNGREPPVVRVQGELAELRQVPPDFAHALLVLPPRRGRVHLAVRLEQVQRHVEVPPYVVQQRRLVAQPRDRQQARVRHLGGVRRTPLAVDPVRGRVDALVEPVLDPRRVPPVREQVVGPSQRRGHLPPVVRRVYAAGRQRGPGFLDHRGQRRAHRRGLRRRVRVEQRVQHADVLDRESAVRRRVQVADVVQAVLVLPRGELVDQPAERSEEGGVVVVRRPSPDIAGNQPAGLAGHGPDTVGNVLEVAEHERNLFLVRLGQQGQEVLVHGSYLSTSRTWMQRAERNCGQRTSEKCTSQHRDLPSVNGCQMLRTVAAELCPVNTSQRVRIRSFPTSMNSCGNRFLVLV